MMRTLKFNLGDNITAFSTLRGNVANPYEPYAGFNACGYTGDNPDHVRECRLILSRDLDVEPQQLIIPRQTHSCNVCFISNPVDEATLNDVDGLVTSTPGLALCINTADCVPVVMADPTAGIIAAVHSGWRGTAGGIVPNAIDMMVGAGARPQAIRVAFGPSICTQCFEVGEEVAANFKSTHGAISRFGLKPHIDLRVAIIQSLISKGIPHKNIYSGAPCSRCNISDYFSARRLGVSSGRTLSVIMIKQEL